MIKGQKDYSRDASYHKNSVHPCQSKDAKNLHTILEGPLEFLYNIVVHHSIPYSLIS